MLKTRNIEKIIVILFLMYLFVNFVINVTKGYMEIGLGQYSIENFKKEYVDEYNSMSEEQRVLNKMKPIEDMTDEELYDKIKGETLQFILFIIIFGSIKTIIENISAIIIFVVIIVVNKKIRREKLNNDDFYKSKQYYRDIIEQKRYMRNIMDR